MTEVEDIIEKGYSQVQAKLIVKKMKFHRMSIDSFLKHYDDCFKTINNLGFSDNDIKNFFILEPRIIYLKDKFESRINNIKDKFLYNTKKDNNLIPRLIIYKEKTINDKYKHLINLGFTKAQIKKMTHNDTKLITRSKKSIKKIFNTFKSLYLNNQQIAKIFVIKSKDICMNSHSLNDRFKKIKDYGFTKKECGILISNMPDVAFKYIDNFDMVFSLFHELGLNNNEIKEELLKYTKLIAYDKKVYDLIKDYLTSKGLSKKQINYITVKAKEIITHNYNYIPYIYDVFYENNFTDDNIKQVLLGNPKILYHSSNKINNVINVLKDFQIQPDDITNICTNFPAIFESSEDTLKEKLDLIFKFDLYDYIIINPKNLIQGSEKTYLRYMYVFNILEQEITEENSKLIYSSKPKNVPDISKLKLLFSYSSYKDNMLEKRLNNTVKNACKVKCYN